MQTSSSLLFLLAVLFLHSLVLAYPSISALHRNKNSSNQKRISFGANDANFPLTPDGRTYHLELKQGDVANRIVIVGDLHRAEVYAMYLESTSFYRSSKRGFLTITGTYKGVPVSIIGTGMGFPMIDFSIRETRAVIQGKMAMIRIGTCGSPSASVKLGDVVVSNSSMFIRRDPDLYREGAALPYTFSKPVNANSELTRNLVNSLTQVIGYNDVQYGLGATADSFYSSQGRITTGYNDRNEHLIDSLVDAHPNLKTLEMETFHLFDMADASQGELSAAAAMLVVAQRHTDKFIDPELAEERERVIGTAALDSIIAFNL